MRVAVNVEQCWHAVPGGTGRVTVDLLRAVKDSRPPGQVSGRGPGQEPGHVARRKRGHAAVELVGVAARHGRPPQDAYRPPIDVRHSRLPQKLLYETWHGVRRPLVESITGPVDIVVGLGGATPPTDAPLVVTIQDLGFLHFLDYYTRHGQRFLRRGLELTRRHATLINVPSQATFDDCVANGIEAERLRIIPWGVDIPTVSDDDVTAARRQIGVNGRYVIVVGTLEPRKNLSRLFEAWRALALHDTTLVVVGPDGWGDAVNDRPDGVLFTGFVDQSVRDALYRGAELSVYPSLFEGFGLPVLESMAVGCPVITSSGTSTQELVVDGGGVAVDPRDVSGLATAIGDLLDDSATRERLSTSGLQVAKRYSWDSVAAAHVELWNEALATTGRPPR